jgi:hypothetical protein
MEKLIEATEPVTGGAHRSGYPSTSQKKKEMT